jgi:hypothetical protein
MHLIHDRNMTMANEGQTARDKQVEITDADMTLKSTPLKYNQDNPTAYKEQIKNETMRADELRKPTVVTQATSKEASTQSFVAKVFNLLKSFITDIFKSKVESAPIKSISENQSYKPKIIDMPKPKAQPSLPASDLSVSSCKQAVPEPQHERNKFTR